MSTYFNQKFDSDLYNSLRPTYPDSFYAELSKYLLKHGKANTLVDLACGTGIATRELAKMASMATEARIVGVDPSPDMIRSAKEASQQGSDSNIEYQSGGDGDLEALFAPQSVDVLTIAEAAHWLSYPALFDRASKVLKHNGTLAIWAYSTEVHIKGQPGFYGMMKEFSFSDKYLGKFWDDGHQILRDLYEAVIPPSKQFKDVRYRAIYGGDPSFNENEPLIISRRAPLKSLYTMLFTWSAYHKWAAANPNVAKDSPDHIINEFYNRVKESTGLSDDSEVEFLWDTVYIFARKR